MNDMHKNPEKMDRDSIIKQYDKIQTLRKNEDNKEIALKMAGRQMELWDYAKKHNFERKLL